MRLRARSQTFSRGRPDVTGRPRTTRRRPSRGLLVATDGERRQLGDALAAIGIRPLNVRRILAEPNIVACYVARIRREPQHPDGVLQDLLDRLYV